MTGYYYKAKRRHLRISQSEVANDIGVSRYTLARYETGKAEIPVTIAIKLNRYFKMTEKHSY